MLAEARVGPETPLPDYMHSLASRLVCVLDWIAEWQGRKICLIVAPFIVALLYEAIARKFFVAPTLWEFGISSMLYGMSFTLGAAYALMRGLHIRASFLYRSFRRQ